MATSSIFKTVIIRDDKSARAFLGAISSSRKAIRKIKEPDVSEKRMNREEIAEVFGASGALLDTLKNQPLIL